MRTGLVCALAALLVVTSAGCSGGGSAPASGPASTPVTATSSSVSAAPEQSYQAPAMATVEFHPDAAVGEGDVLVDLSCTAQGYVGVSAKSDKRLKFRTQIGEIQYTYNLPNDGTPTFYPLQSGDGDYTFIVFENTHDTNYIKKYTTQAAVALESEFAPFLRSSQFVDYTADSACVAKAAELASSAADQVGAVANIYDYIVGHIAYDYDKARTVESGYLPTPDETLSTGKGICFDYAALAAAMLRSQGIPAKLITGYVSPNNVYHAWNMVWLEETGWITVEFKAPANQWNRVDMTFAASGTDADFIGDGSNYTDYLTY